MPLLKNIPILLKIFKLITSIFYRNEILPETILEKKTFNDQIFDQKIIKEEIKIKNIIQEPEIKTDKNIEILLKTCGVIIIICIILLLIGDGGNSDGMISPDITPPPSPKDIIPPEIPIPPFQPDPELIKKLVEKLNVVATKRIVITVYEHLFDRSTKELKTDIPYAILNLRSLMDRFRYHDPKSDIPDFDTFSDLTYDIIDALQGIN